MGIPAMSEMVFGALQKHEAVTEQCHTDVALTCHSKLRT